MLEKIWGFVKSEGSEFYSYLKQYKNQNLYTDDQPTVPKDNDNGAGFNFKKYLPVIFIVVIVVIALVVILKRR